MNWLLSPRSVISANIHYLLVLSLPKVLVAPSDRGVLLLQPARGSHFLQVFQEVLEVQVFQVNPLHQTPASLS